MRSKSWKLVGDFAENLELLVSSESGRVAFGPAMQALRKQAVYAQAGRGACKMAKEVGCATAKFHVKFLCEHVQDLRLLSKLSGFPLKYLQHSLSSTAGKELPASMQQERSGSKDTAGITIDLRKELITRFFSGNSEVYSGARSTRRQVGIRLHELQHRFFAHFPLLCREIARLWPEEYEKILDAQKAGKPISYFERCIILSVQAAKKQGFDVKREHATRY